jgi:hypothetical protein
MARLESVTHISRGNERKDNKRRCKMDCSDLYVKMSKNAEDIQRLWVPSEGDMFADELCHVSMVSPSILDHLDRSLKEGTRERYVWLPRQDQLQEMILPVFKGNCYWMLEECYKFIHPPYSAKLESMEQIWLAFVMQEKFGKTWNGENWEVTRK